MGSIARATAPGVTVRVLRAARQHLDSIVRIERESFSDPWSERAFLGMIDSPLAIFLVATSGEAVVGYAAATAAREDGEILNVAVDETLRAKGIGGTLLDAAIAALRDQLVERVFLEVRESNAAARGLYASRGFSEISVRKNYYRMPGEDAVVMKLELQKT